MASKTVVFAANRGYALTSSRTHLIEQFLLGGWTVVLATSDDAESQLLCDMGANLEPISFNRRGFAPLLDLQAFRSLVSIYRRWQPVLIQHFHSKPVILGSLAARHALGPSVRVVNTITGLGHAFIAGGLAAKLAALGYSLGLPRADLVVFQNSDDRQLFLDRGWVTTSQARIILGSGVDVSHFTLVDRRARDMSQPVLVMVGRLLKQKGIAEFVEVARRVKMKWPQARFLLAGEEDFVHPDAVDINWVYNQKEIEYLGRIDNVDELLALADIFLFPSYREGVPRAVLEASSKGLPTVGFDVPGVREVVRDGETGYLVPHQDLASLTDRVTHLIENDSQRIEMGLAARRMAEESFDIRAIQRQYSTLYQELGAEL